MPKVQPVFEKKTNLKSQNLQPGTSDLKTSKHPTLKPGTSDPRNLQTSKRRNLETSICFCMAFPMVFLWFLMGLRNFPVGSLGISLRVLLFCLFPLRFFIVFPQFPYGFHCLLPGFPFILGKTTKTEKIQKEKRTNIPN